MTDSTTTICVYLGSRTGASPDYAKAARDLGYELGQRGLKLVYGGASVGLMGILADAALEAGAEVTGIIPRTLVEKEIAHESLTSLEVVDSMHARKERMMELSDAFVLLPGGYGSLEEIFEAITWRQLKLHDKPCGILNLNGYYDALLQFLDHGVAENFVRKELRDQLIVEPSCSRLLDQLTC